MYRSNWIIKDLYSQLSISAAYHLKVIRFFHMSNYYPPQDTVPHGETALGGGQGFKSGWPFTKYLLIPLRTCQGSKGAKNPRSISHLFVEPKWDLWFMQSHCMINCPMAWMGLFFVVINCIQLAGFYLCVCLTVVSFTCVVWDR